MEFYCHYNDHVTHCMLKWRSEDNFLKLVSPSTVCVLGIGCSVIRLNAFTC